MVGDHPLNTNRMEFLMRLTLPVSLALFLAGCPVDSPDAPPPVSADPVAGNAELGICSGGDLITVSSIENRHGTVLDAHVGASGMVGIASEDQTLKFWDARTGDAAGAVEGFEYMPAFALDSELTTVALDASGSLAASGETTGRLAVWQVGDSEMVQDFGAPGEAPITAAAFSPDGRQVVTADGSFGGAVAVRDIGSGTAIEAGEGGLWQVAHLGYSPDGNSVAVTGDIYGSPSVDIISSAFPTVSIALWESLSLQIDHGRIGARAAVWTPDGSQLIVIGDRFAAVLDVEAAAESRIETAAALALFDDHDPVDVAVDPSGRWFATIGSEGDLRFHAVADLADLGGSSLGQPVAVGLSADGSRVAAVHLDGTVELLGCAE